jgi:hypothetical protein
MVYLKPRNYSVVEHCIVGRLGKNEASGISDEQSQFVVGYCCSLCLLGQKAARLSCQDIQSADRYVTAGHPECIRYHSVYMKDLREAFHSFNKCCRLCDGLNGIKRLLQRPGFVF